MNRPLVLLVSATVGLVAGSVYASDSHGSGHAPAPHVSSPSKSTSKLAGTTTATAAKPAGTSTKAKAAPAATSAASAATFTPGEVRKRLVDGNVWFARGGIPVGDVTPTRRASVAPSQAPWVTVLTCADSRVPPEHLFNVGLGEMFTVRVAGNVADPVTVGSVEYAAEHLHTPVVLVLGHERCGAVKAAMGTDKLGPNLDALLGLVRPGIKGAADLDAAIDANVRAQVAALGKSAILAHLQGQGHLSVIGGRYDLDSGVVDFLGDALAGAPVSPMSPVPFTR